MIDFAVAAAVRYIANDGVLAACYWAGIDDQFYMPPIVDADGNSSRHLVGYGPWGIIDGFRRWKPEAIATRNMYSPVVVKGSDPSALMVDNRFDFTDLSEVRFSWRSLLSPGGPSSSGTGSASGPPHATNVTLALDGLGGDVTRIELNATSPRGYLINTWHVGAEELVFAPPPSRRPSSADDAPGGVVVKVGPDGSLTITVGPVVWTVSKALSLSAVNGTTPVIEAGPTLLVLSVDNSGPTKLAEDTDRRSDAADEALTSRISIEMRALLGASCSY